MNPENAATESVNETAPQPDHRWDVKADKQLRVDLDQSLQNLKELTPSRERALAITKIQEAIMWLGMDLKRMHTPDPYPHSYDPTSPVIDPTADNLKL